MARDLENHSAWQKAYRVKNPERVQGWDQAKYSRDREKIIARVSRYQAANKERAREWKRRWDQKNPERRALNEQRRRARKLAADDGFTLAEWHEILDRHLHCCAYCFGLGEMTMDHVVPLSRGGRHAAHNIVPACFSCNASKGNRMVCDR